MLGGTYCVDHTGSHLCTCVKPQNHFENENSTMLESMEAATIFNVTGRYGRRDGEDHFSGHIPVFRTRRGGHAATRTKPVGLVRGTQ